MNSACYRSFRLLPALLLIAFMASACARGPVIRDRRVVVMDFENATHDAQYDGLAKGLAEMLTALLVNQDRVAVVERQDLAGSFAMARGDASRWYEIARKADLDYLVTGSVSSLDSNFVVNARLLSVSTGQIVKGSSITRSCNRVEDLYPVMEAVARNMGYSLKFLAEQHDRQALGQPMIAEGAPPIAQE